MSRKSVMAFFFVVAGVAAQFSVPQALAIEATAASCGQGGVAIADFDGDGIPDSVRVADGIEAVLSRRPDQASKISVTRLAAAGEFRLAYGDFNGDGTADLVVANAGAGIEIFNGGAGGFPETASESLLLGGGNSVGALAVVDLDRDGLPELLVAGTVENFVARGVAPGARSLTPAFNGKSPSPSFAIAAMDFERDGDLDVFVGKDGRDELYIQEKAGFRAATATEFSLADSGITTSFCIDDVDGDQNPDLIAGTRAVYLSSSSGSMIMRAAARAATPKPTEVADPAAYVPFNGKIYFTSHQGGGTPPYLFRPLVGYVDTNYDANGTKNNIHVLLNGQTSSIGIPYGITVDSATGKMYWIDENTRVLRANLTDGSGLETVLTGLTGAYSLAYVSSQNLLLVGSAQYVRIYDLEWGSLYPIHTIKLGNEPSSISALALTISQDTLYIAAADPVSDAGQQSGAIYKVSIKAILEGHGYTATSTASLLVDNLYRPTGVAIDLDVQRVYWLDKVARNIGYSYLSGAQSGTKFVESYLPSSDLDNPNLVIDSLGTRYWPQGRTIKEQLASEDWTIWTTYPYTLSYVANSIALLTMDTARCDDLNPCTKETVTRNSCSTTVVPEGGSCDDGLFCNGISTCNAAGICVPGSVPCTGSVGDDDSNCKESCNEATDDCSGNDPNYSHCAYVYPGGVVDRCIEYICAGGSCVPQRQLCSGADGDSNCHESCDATTRTCVGNDPNGSACNDGQFCTTTDQCSNGVCVGSGSPCWGADGDANCRESCDETNHSCTGADPNGSTCDDGLFCTTTSSCQSGTCVGSGSPCQGADGDANCHESCDEASDSCAANDPNGSSCNDGLFCTSQDTCSNGVCQGGASPCSSVGGCSQSCSESTDTCTLTGTCNTSGSCTNDAQCDDGNPCTEDECTPSLTSGTRIAETSGRISTRSTYQATSTCKHTNKPNLTLCDDGDACSTASKCSSGVCTATSTLNCNDSNAGTVDYCVSGQCRYYVGSCDDNNDCTEDAIDPQSGTCIHTNYHEDQNCRTNPNGLGFDTQCNEHAICRSGSCVFPGLGCNDNNPCTADTCDGVNCQYLYILDLTTGVGPKCDDGNLCTSQDLCHGGAGCYGTAVSNCGSSLVACDAEHCDDGNPCTLDGCFGGQCRHTAQPSGTSCDDQNPCTTAAGVCDGLGQCNTPASDPCSGGAVCANTCKATTATTYTCLTPSGTTCTDDGNPCTDNYCNGSGNCIAAANSASCSDGLFCNGTDSCRGGACEVHSGDPCTGGSECNNTCSEANDSCRIDGTACSDDGNTCTLNLCNGGACTAFSNQGTCDDGNAGNGSDSCAFGACRVHSLDHAGVADGQFQSKFDEVPVAGLTLLGNAQYAAGAVLLTSLIPANQVGTVIVDDLTPGLAASGFSAAFQLYFGDGVSGGDGISFVFGPVDGTIGSRADAGSGLAIVFDSTAGQIRASYNGSLVGQGSTTSMRTSNLIDVEVKVANGRLSVAFAHAAVISNAMVGSWAPSAGWQFAFGASTGSAGDGQAVDNLVLAQFTNNAIGTDFGTASAAYTTYGSTTIGDDGGNSVAKLTTATNNQVGSLVFGALDGTRAARSFRARFRLRIGGGTGADGASFSYGDLPNAAFNDSGAGSGLRVLFDTFNNGSGDVYNAIELRYGPTSTSIAAETVNTRTLRTNSYADVVVVVAADGRVVVQHANGIDTSLPILDTVIPGWAPQPGWRFGFGARTGGSYDNHFVDDVEIETSACGDGQLDAGEECDDGNLANGDCCSATCQAEAYGSSCGDSADSECSNPDTCDGIGHCQANDELTGTLCGSTADTACTRADSCNGTGTCLSNDLAAGVACGDPNSSECDAPDSCDGAGGCAGNYSTTNSPCGDASDTICTDPDTCDASGHCLANDVASGIVCGDTSVSECSGPDICVDGVCSSNDATVGSPCSDQSDSPCSAPDSCDGEGSCLSNHRVGAVCGDVTSSECTQSDVCDENGVCQSRDRADGTPCGANASDECVHPDSCQGGVCVRNFVTTGSGCGDSTTRLCDEADSCNGIGRCRRNFSPSGTACDDEGDPCTNDACDGSASCLHTLATPVCGDGNRCSTEQCDDANQQRSDGCSPACESEAALDKAGQKCVAALNKQGIKVAATQGKELQSCLTSFVAGLGGDLSACVHGDVSGKIFKARAKTEAVQAKACPTTPDFGFATAQSINDAATNEIVGLFASLVGSDPNSAIALSSVDSGKSRCQVGVTSALLGLLQAKAGAFLSCKKAGLKGKKAEPLLSSYDLAACFNAMTEGTNLKVFAAGTKLDLALRDICPTDSAWLGAAFPGDCHDGVDSTCLRRLVDCHVCRMFDGLDSLTQDCDQFDDGQSNGSCN